MHSRNYRSFQETAADDFENQTCPILLSASSYPAFWRGTSRTWSGSSSTTFNDGLGKAKRATDTKSIRVDRRESKCADQLAPMPRIRRIHHDWKHFHRLRLASRVRSILTFRSCKKLYFYRWGPCIEGRDVHCHNQSNSF